MPNHSPGPLKRMRLIDKNGDVLEFDSTGGYLVNVDIEHHKIHDGEHYTCSEFLVMASETKYWHILAPNTSVRVHYRYIVSSGGGVIVDLREAPTLSANGAPGTILNSDRNLGIADVNTLCFTTPTITGGADGDRIGGTVVGAGKVGGIVERNNEVILKQGVSYLLKVISGSVNNDVTVESIFYEVAM